MGVQQSWRILACRGSTWASQLMHRCCLCPCFFLFTLCLPVVGQAALSAHQMAPVLSQSSFLLLSAHYLILSQARPGNILLSLSSTALHPLPPWRRQKQNKLIMNQSFPFSLCPLLPPLIFYMDPFCLFPPVCLGCGLHSSPALSIPGSLAGSFRCQQEFSGG